MLEFVPCTNETLKAMLPHIRRCPYLLSDLSAGALFMWGPGSDTQFCVWHETFVVRRNIGEQPAFSWPYGEDADGMVDELLAYVRQHGLAMRFFAVNADMLEVIRRDPRLQPVMSAYDSKWSDYIYDFEGAYPAMYQGFVRLVWEMLGCPLRLVNREDDSGDPGLRTSKRQYQPIGMVDKHLVHVKSPAASIDALPALRRGDVVLTAFREDDREAYLRLNTDVENNRWWGYDYREDVGITGPVDRDTFYDGMRYDMRAGESVNFAVRLSEDGALIGEAILWRFTLDGVAEVGCRLFPEYQGRGRGRAAFGAAVEFAENALKLSVRARCFLENAPSYRMITACGLEVRGRDEKYFYFGRSA